MLPLLIEKLGDTGKGGGSISKSKSRRPRTRPSDMTPTDQERKRRRTKGFSARYILKEPTQTELSKALIENSNESTKETIAKGKGEQNKTSFLGAKIKEEPIDYE